MTVKRVRKDGQPWHNNIGRWVDTLTVEQRGSLFQSGARAQWGPEKEKPKKADDGPWTWPIDLSRYDRCAMLTAGEEDLLTRYAEAYRFYRYGRTMDFGPSLNRLVQPLNDNKTATAFTKPVDRIVGDAIAAWEKVRPHGAKRADWKTGEFVDFLFMVRLTGVGKSYLNNALIPALCAKAGVPLADVRGNITTHRARSTIASQLFNAKEPMTLFELQEWLGHSSPSATQHYAKITPLKMAKSYADAGYFARNLRAIEVLVDQDVVRAGIASTEPWKFYDLGHGYCTYDFFEQCPHRMACAKCDFYMPKQSTAALLLEGKANLLHLLQEIPLGEAEEAAVEDGVAAYEKLLLRLADAPTPAGPTQRQIGSVLVQITSFRAAPGSSAT